MTEEMHKALSTLFDKGYEVGYKKAKADFDRPHGEWVEDGAYYKCPFCSNFVLKDDGKPYYCDHCGADMRPRILDQAVDGEGKDGNVREGEVE